MPHQPGSVLHARYRIDRQLGKGGMGAVYLAFDQTLHIHVAVKENLNLNPESERQFRREASLLAGLRHPNLPRVTDHFILEGRQYLVMDYIEGEDLHNRTARQLPNVGEVLRWADGLCDALAYLHSRQPPIIHRDIKPSNLKLQPDGAVILVDFGIAKVVDQAQTTTGARGLTPGFSPPEQYGGTRTDARSDQYSLAATLYALLTGRPPADSIERMLKKEELKPASMLNPAVPPQVEAALERALAIDQDDRFPDISAFREALRGAPAAATVRAQAPVAPKKRGRTAALLIGAAALVILIGGGGGLALLAGWLPSGLAPTASATLPAAALGFTWTPSPSPMPASATPTATLGPTATLTPVPSPTETVFLLGGGGRIAFVSNREDGRTLQIWTMNPDGSDPRQLTYGPGDKTDPTWSPDGTRLLYVAPAGSNGQDIWVINADGSVPIDLTQSPGDDTDPAWSRDGGRIAFAATRNTGVPQVYLMDMACEPPPDSCVASGAHNLTDGYAHEYSPVWSPDGSQLAVAASINEALGRIFLRSTAGGNPPVWFDRSDTIIGADDLAWSPNGLYLAFTWYVSHQNEIYLVPLSDPRAWERLTNTAGNREPAFSPDGMYIAFTSTRDQNPEIYIMTANGADETNITNRPGGVDMQPDWQPPP
jgi:Tol biopolymer transport system component